MEPVLFFGGNRSSIDPRIGLINYGPYGRLIKGEEEPRTIKAGIVGTRNAKKLMENWLEKIDVRVSGKVDLTSNRREVDFPGLGLTGPLRFKIESDDSAFEYIDEKEIKLLETLPRKGRVEKLFEMYDQKLADLSTTTDPNPDVVYLPLSPKTLELCRDPSSKTDKILYQRKTEKIGEEVPLFNFHHAIKVSAFKHGGLVSQIIKPGTLGSGASNQDPATIAWNFTVASYYKATGTPWKLSSLDDETCYVGLSFYREIKDRKSNLRCSMAHVYLRTGESQVIRGRPFTWDSTNKGSPFLTSPELAEEIITDVISLYKRQRNNLDPTRVVIHKSSPFRDEEIEGFNQALGNIETADYIHINEHSNIRLFPKGELYPPIRGTFIYSGDQSILYTTGYVPLMDTYKGSSLPSPLMLKAYRLDSSQEQIARDIMALTKLDWNNADFNSRMPVTISVSRKVGEILSESSMQEVNDFPTSYKYYM
jgi:hypothetical protein